MKKTILFHASCICALSCSADGPGIGRTVQGLSSSPHSDAVSGTTFSISDPIHWSEACPDDRWVGKGTCPAPGASFGGSWTRSKLFDPSVGFVPTALRDYCVYQWMPSAVGNAPDLGSLPQSPGTALGRDCHVVAPLSSSYASANAATLETAFFEQVDRLNVLPQAVTPGPLTSVLVVDASTDQGVPLAGPGQSDHGRMMGAVINALACPLPGPACHGSVASTLGLPIEVHPVHGIRRVPAHGGFFGSFGDVAAAVHRGLARMGSSSNHLIVNLSIGWDGVHGGSYHSSPSELSPPVRALHEVIEAASCSGALIFGAAGNQGGGPHSSIGPMYPAAWEDKPAPSASRCIALGWSHGPPGSVSTYRPLLYAVSGVDGRDLDLSNQREGARARLAAAAHFATITNGLGGFLGPSTGSSVGAAVASAASSIVWDLSPSLSPHDVAATLYDSGVDLGRMAEVCHGSTCPNTKRLSVCRATQRACHLGGNCSFVPSCPATSAGRDARATGLNFTPPSGQTVLPSPHWAPPKAYGWPCNSELRSVVGPGAVSEPCPIDQFFSLLDAPWTRPQGGEIYCPVCGCQGISGDLCDLSLEFTSATSLPSISNLLIVVEDTAGNVTRLDLGASASSIQPGTSIAISSFELGVTLSDVQSLSIEGVEGTEVAFSEDLLTDF